MNAVGTIVGIIGILVIIGCVHALLFGSTTSMSFSDGSPDTQKVVDTVGNTGNDTVHAKELPREMRHQFADLKDVRMTPDEQKKYSQDLPHPNDANYLHYKSPRTILKTTGCLNCSEGSSIVPGKPSCLTNKYDGGLLKTNGMLSDEFNIPYMGNHVVSLPMTDGLGEPNQGCLSEYNL